MAELSPSDFPPQLIYDDADRALYAVRSDAIDRYDLLTASRTGTWRFGSVLLGADLAPDASALYVTERNPVNDKSVLHRLNLADNTVIDLPYDLAAGEHGGEDVAVMSNGTALISSFDRRTVRSLDLVSGTPSIVADPTGPGTTAVGVQGAQLLRDAHRDIAVVSDRYYDHGTPTPVNVFNVADGTFQQHRLGIPAVPSTISADGSLVAAVHSDVDAPVLGAPVFDLRNDTVATLLPIGDYPAAFDPTRPVLYTVNGATDLVSAFDTNTWTKLFDLPLDGHINVAYMPGITISDDGSLLFVSTESKLVTPGGLRMYALKDQPVISGIPATIRPGQPVTFTITMQSPSGGIASDFSGRVDFRSSDLNAVLPPPVTFTPANNGVLTASVTFNSVSQLPAESRTLSAIVNATGATGTSSAVFVDADGPTVIASVGELAAGDQHTAIYANFTDMSGFDPKTFGDDDVVVVTPRGTEIRTRLTSQHPIDQLPTYGAKPKTLAQYDFLPPGKFWEANDNGDYQVYLREGAVTDALGNPVVGGSIGSFTVELGEFTRGEGEAVPDAQLDVNVAGVGSRGKTFFTGSTLTANVTVHNRGKGKLGGGTLTLNLGTGAREVPLAEQHLSLDLGPGGKRKINFQVQLDNTIASESCTVDGVFVSDDDESDLDNNEGWSWNFSILEPSNSLWLQSYAPFQFEPGARQSVTLQIEGFSRYPASAKYGLVIRATDPTDDKPIAVLATLTKSLTLKPGKAKALTIKFVTPRTVSRGDYLLSLDVISAST